MVDLTINTDIVRRDGKDYIKIKDVQVDFTIGDFFANSVCENINPFINGMINSAININWQLLIMVVGPFLKKYIGEMIISIITPILDKIAIQDIIQP